MSDDDLDGLYEHAPCGYVSTAPDGMIVRANETLRAWTQRDLLIGVRFQDLLTPAGRIFHDTHFAPLLALEGAVRELAFDLVRSGHPPLPVFVSSRAVRDAAGHVRLHRTTLFDCTQRRRYEDELLRARAYAERQTAARDALLAMISHDMRSPLGSITMAADLVEEAPGPDERARYLRIIRTAAGTALDLVTALLTESKLASGTVTWERAELDLRVVLEEVTSLFALKAEAKGIRLVTRLDPDLPRTLLGDRFKLGQIITNLLGNALKFTHQGEVRIEVRVIELFEGIAKIEFRISDTGIGIPADQLATIFDDFTQAPSSGRYGGAGLGLAICRKLLAIEGSTIHVESALGHGSTFAFTLRFAVPRPR